MPLEENFDFDIKSLGSFLNKKLKKPITSMDEVELLNQCYKNELVEYIKDLRKELILIKNELNRRDKLSKDEINNLRKRIREIWEQI